MDPDIRALCLTAFALAITMLLLGVMLSYVATHSGC